MRRIKGLLAAVVLAQAPLCAAQSSPLRETAVAACMRGGGDFEIVGRARTQASRMFLPAGVDLRWHSDPRFCRDSRERAVLVTIFRDTPPDRPPSALGRALPFEGVHVEVFYDRMLGAPEPMRVLLLAHVLVHEITHLLEGTDSHSETGVMKAHWDADDFMHMRRESLRFTPLDLALIRQGLAQWNQAHASGMLLAAAQ